MADPFSGGTIAGNILPDATGRDLGSQTQRWDAFIQTLDINSLVSLAASGVFTNTQQNEYLTSILNGLVIGTEYSLQQGGNFATDAFAGAIAVPSTASVHQANAVAGYVTNASTTTQPVAVYGQCRSTASGADAIAANFVVAGTSGIGNASTTALELDHNPNNVTDTGTTLTVNYGTSVQSTNLNAIVVQATNPALAQYTAGLVFSQGATGGASTHPAVSLAAIGAGLNKASQSINFSSNDPTSGTHSGTLALTAAGVLQLTNATGLTSSSVIKSTAIGSGTSSGVSTVAAGQSGLAVKDTTQALDSKLWDVAAGIDSNTLRFRAVNDAENAAVTWLKATRNATSTVAVDATGSSSVALPNITINGGTAITGMVVYSQTVTPSSVNAATAAEQDFTVTGVTTADKIIVNPVATGNSTMVGAARVKSANTVSIQFVNPTAGSLTPGAGTYTFIAIRS